MWFKKKPKPTKAERLLELKAKLARYKKLPEEDFTIVGSGPLMPMKHGIDEKPKVIARVEARSPT